MFVGYTTWKIAGYSVAVGKALQLLRQVPQYSIIIMGNLIGYIHITMYRYAMYVVWMHNILFCSTQRCKRKIINLYCLPNYTYVRFCSFGSFNYFIWLGSFSFVLVSSSQTAKSAERSVASPTIPYTYSIKQFIGAA